MRNQLAITQLHWLILKWTLTGLGERLDCVRRVLSRDLARDVAVLVEVDAGRDARLEKAVVAHFFGAVRFPGGLLGAAIQGPERR